MANKTGLASWEAIIVDKMTSLRLNTVSVFLAALLNVKENSIRQRLREWYKESKAQKGEKRVEVDVTRCFVPLVTWVLSWWSADEK